MPVKVTDGAWDTIFGAPHSGTDDVVARGIRYAVDNGAQIINMSIGRIGQEGCGTNPDRVGCAPVLEEAIRYAVGKGVFVAMGGILQQTLDLGLVETYLECLRALRHRVSTG